MQPEPDTRVIPPRAERDDSDPSPADPPAGFDQPALLRRWVGRYELVKRVAHGGMATVYLGRAKGQAGFEKIVAIKLIHPHLASEAEFVRMFLDEARIAARIHHPHVVEILDLGESDGAYFMVMEFIEGQNLAALVRASKGDLLSLNICLRIAADALEGLGAAHELRDADGHPYELVHRDVSPHNILINLDGWAKVGDFGIMKAAGKPSNTRTGELRGKLAYMSPEQARGEGQVDHRTDLFAVGVILWELLSGERLFASATEAATLEKVIACKVPSFAKARPELDEHPELRAGLERLLARALDSDPKQRPADAGGMLAEIKALQRFADELSNVDVRSELGARMRKLFSARVEYDRAALRRTGEHAAVADWATDSTARIPRPPTGSSPTLSGGTPMPVAASGSGEIGRPPTQSNPSVVLAAPSPLAQWTMWLLLPMLGAGIALAAMFLLGPGLGREEPVEPPPSEPSDIAEATPAAEPTPKLAPSELAATELHPDPATAIRWSFSTTPSEAAVFIAGEARGRTPLELELAPGESSVDVRLELAGHEPLLMELTPSRDQTISRALVPLAPKPTLSKRVRKASKVKTPSDDTGEPPATKKDFIPVPDSLRDE